MDVNMNLVSNINSDYPDAFTSVFNAYYTSLCRFAEKIVQDSDDAEDVVSEVFTRLWAKQFYTEAGSNVKSFLYTAVRNASIDFLRKKATQINGNKNLEYLLQQDEQFFSELWRAEVIQEIIQEIEALPERCRGVFKKLYFDGLSPEKVAEQMSIAKSTVYSQKSLAVKTLRRKLFPDSLFAAAAVATTATALLTVIGLMLYLIIYAVRAFTDQFSV